MKRAVIVAAMLLSGLISAYAQNNTSKEQDPPDVMAAKTADYLAEYLNLDDRQVFQVDSTLQYVYPAMIAEIEAARRSGVSGQEMFLLISDKWSEKIDSTYRCIFNDKQWSRYLKTPQGKEKKARDKRMQKRRATQEGEKQR